MSEVKHTPGPWILTTCPVETNDTAASIYGPYKNGGSPFICDISRSPGEGQAAANAKLIATAPDLFAAVEKALEIKQLWFPAGDYSVEHEGEAQALQSMLNSFEAAYKKATT